jgi:hypothetical protein
MRMAASACHVLHVIFDPRGARTGASRRSVGPLDLATTSGRAALRLAGDLPAPVFALVLAADFALALVGAGLRPPVAFRVDVVFVRVAARAAMADP